jgi:POTRA domain, FtsQ-type
MEHGPDLHGEFPPAESLNMRLPQDGAQENAAHEAHAHEAHMHERRRNGRHAPGGAARRQRRGMSRRARTRHDGTARPPATRMPLWKRVQRWSALLLFLLSAELMGAALTSRHFAVVAVDVIGNDVTPLDAVRPVQTALIGQNWIRAHTARAARALETLPAVRVADVVRVMDWPPRLAISITERKPFARVGAGRDWWVVDEQGVPFRVAKANDAALYAITGPRLQPRLGRPLPSAAWRPVVAFAAALVQDQQRGGRWNLRRIYMDKHGYASLRLMGGAHDEMLVQLGMDHWPAKLQRARQALAFFEETGRPAATLNLVSFTMPTWTPRQASDTTSSVTTSSATRSG